MTTNYVAIFTDLSERVAAEQAIRASEQRYRTMFESAPEGVWIIGADARTLEVNQHLCDLLGYAREDMLGKEPTDFTDAENTRIFEEQKNQRATTHRRNYEIALRHRDGHNIPVHFSATNLYGEGGTLAAALAFVTDISERKMHEREMRRLHEELEQRVVERTRACRLRTASWKHFPTPSPTICAHRCGPSTASATPLRRSMAACSTTTGRITFLACVPGPSAWGNSSTTYWSSPQLSRREMDIVPLDLSALANDVARELRDGEPLRKVEWIVAPDLRARGDAVLLRVVLMNLLGNAWKYTARCSLAKIEFGLGETQGRRAFFVRDNGAGFDMAHVGKLFGAFQRLHSPRRISRQRHRPGHGGAHRPSPWRRGVG
ncbi:MAG: PAS domain S-box protein [Rhodocyclaceae bacterium]|nr:PAS domain S-box protein [Rhodocyclaceae bacterium]